MKKSLLMLAVLAGLLTVAQAQEAPKPNTTPMPKDRPQEQGVGIGQVGMSVPAAAYYEGGQPAMYAFIGQELKYPLLAKRNRMQGRCIVSFTLTADGVISNERIVKQVGGGTGDEAMRVVRLLKFKKPEYPVNLSLPIDFKLGATGANAAN